MTDSRCSHHPARDISSYTYLSPRLSPSSLALRSVAPESLACQAACMWVKLAHMPRDSGINRGDDSAMSIRSFSESLCPGMMSVVTSPICRAHASV